MSAGQSTYFCKNGHMVYDTGNDEVFYDEHIEKCSHCECTEIRSVHEWYDEEYQYDEKTGKPDLDIEVPHKPIRFEEQYYICHKARFNLYEKVKGKFVKLKIKNTEVYRKSCIPVFDVSKLFGE